jgi:hypothetical protein
MGILSLKSSVSNTKGEKMQILKLWLPIIFILIGFNGCGEVKEKKSDPKILLNEKENKLPKSILKISNAETEKLLMSSLPKVATIKKYIYDNINIYDKTSSIMIESIEQYND